MFLHQFLEDIAKLNAPKHTEVCGEINYCGGAIWFDDPELQYEIAQLKDDVATEADIAKGLGKENERLEQAVKELEVKLEEKSELISSYTISPTDTIEDLVSRNEWQAEQLTVYKDSSNRYNKKVLDLERELKETRARLNKAVVKRDVMTGELIATYKDIEYKMIKK